MRGTKSVSDKKLASSRKLSNSQGAPKKREAPIKPPEGFGASAGAALPNRNATRRPRKDKVDGAGGRLFVVALARGMSVLSAFRIGDGPLGNQELAERTGLPLPTVSRLTNTLTQLGYLVYRPRTSLYELGGQALTLGQVALAGLDIRNVARPFMRELCKLGNSNVGLGIRDRSKILYVETCEGESLIGLRLHAGSRIPMATSAMGRAYLATVDVEEREAIYKQLQKENSENWPRLHRDIGRAIESVRSKGFCTAIRAWSSDINAAATAVSTPDGKVFSLGIGGPSYLVSSEFLEEEVGPKLVAAARQIALAIGGTLPT